MKMRKIALFFIVCLVQTTVLAQDDVTIGKYRNNPSLNKKLYVSYGDLDYVEVLRYINDLKEVLRCIIIF
jgi:hypothetical protein